MTAPIDRSLLPADVRDGGPDARKLYGAALDFERLLTAQLTKSLVADALPADEEGDSPSPYREMLPDALADAVEQGGGLGLAPSLYEALKQEKGS